MESTTPTVRTSTIASASTSTVDPATSWADSLGGGAGEDPGCLGRQTCWATWQEDLAAFEVQQPRGDYLRSMGTAWRGRTMLHAEEGLWLVERGMLAVRPFRTNPREGHQTLTTGAANVAPPESVLKPAHVGRATNEHGVQAATSDSRPSATMGRADQDGREEEPQDWAKRELPGPGGALDAGLSPRRKALALPPPRASCTAESSKSKLLPNGTSEMTPIGEPERKPDFGGADQTTQKTQGKEWSRTTVATPGATQSRGGHKRGRSGSRGSERRRGTVPALPVPTGVLHDMVLSRAGIPWECYRAYVELKQRSYVVRRQPEDTIGYQDDAPRAAPLAWFGCPPFKTHSCNKPDTNDRNIKNNDVRTNPNAGANINSGSSDANGADSFPLSSPFSSSSSFSSSPTQPPSSPPLPLPVTFAVYNNQPGCSSFRKSNPGPPDALLVVCRFGDPMPEHGSLVALAKHHAAMKANVEAPQRPRRRDDSAGGAGRDFVSAKELPRRGCVRRESAAGGDGREGAAHTGGRGVGAAGGAINRRQQRQPMGEGKDTLNTHQDGKDEADLPHQNSGEVGRERGVALGNHPGGGEETAGSLNVLLPGEAVGDGAGLSPTGRQGGRLSDDRLRMKRSDFQRNCGKDGGMGESHAKTCVGRYSGSLSGAGAEEVPPMTRGVKLAVVAGEAGVQLFDVGLYDAGESADGVGIS